VLHFSNLFSLFLQQNKIKHSLIEWFLSANAMSVHVQIVHFKVCKTGLSSMTDPINQQQKCPVTIYHSRAQMFDFSNKKFVPYYLLQPSCAIFRRVPS